MSESCIRPGSHPPREHNRWYHQRDTDKAHKTTACKRGGCVKTTGHGLRCNEGQNMLTCSDTSGTRQEPPLQPARPQLHRTAEDRTGLIMRISFMSRISCSLKSYLLSSQMILSCSPFLGKTNKGRKLKCFQGGVWNYQFLNAINR